MKPSAQTEMSTRPDATYDVLVIGGGPAGENAADLAARGGLRVGLIEHDLLGGECTYWACMPSKALLRPGEALEAIRRVPGGPSSRQRNARCRRGASPPRCSCRSLGRLGPGGLAGRASGGPDSWTRADSRRAASIRHRS
jgi:hypothetical protein